MHQFQNGALPFNVAATLTAHIPKLETDSRKRAAVRGAVQLAEFGWELSSQEQGRRFPR